MVNIHYFRDTSAAYNLSQVSENIKDGDVLVCQKEKIVGILNKAWPVRVFGEKSGVLEELKPGSDWNSFQDGKYKLSYETAKKIYEDMLKIDFNFKEDAEEDPFINQREDLNVDMSVASGDMLIQLYKLAYDLDQKGLHSEAEEIEEVMKLMAKRVGLKAEGMVALANYFDKLGDYDLADQLDNMVICKTANKPLMEALKAGDFEAAKSISEKLNLPPEIFSIMLTQFKKEKSESIDDVRRNIENTYSSFIQNKNIDKALAADEASKLVKLIHIFNEKARSESYKLRDMTINDKSLTKQDRVDKLQEARNLEDEVAKWKEIINKISIFS